MSTSNNRLIAKNTIILSVQMVIGLIVGLYTGRLVLSTLGVVDYGVYSVAGGVITTLSFLTGALAAGSSRFIIYDLGKGDIPALKRTVSNIMTVHFVLAGIILFVAETVGIWFVCTQLVIPEERLTAAIWVYQFSVFSFLMSIISAPYNAMIMAHEHITIYAYLKMIDIILKLLIVYVIMAAPLDKLVLYAFLVLCVDIGNRLFYGFYCSRNFEEARSGFSFNMSQFRDIFSFSGWMCIGNVASMFSNQGLNILLNLFFGPVVNAANGISTMVLGQISSYGLQLQVAMRPQVIKNYASGNRERMQFLIFAGAKFSFYITLALSLPVVMEIHQFLAWWLVEVPDWTSQFVIISICITLVQIIGVSLYGGAMATGEVKKYQTAQAIIMLLFLPITYVVLKIVDSSPVLPFVLLLFFRIVCEVVLAIIALRQLELSIRAYLKSTIRPILYVLLLAPIIPIVLRFHMEEGVWSFFVICSVSLACALFVSYYVGCTKEEKAMVKNYCNSFIQKLRKKNNNG